MVTCSLAQGKFTATKGTVVLFSYEGAQPPAPTPAAKRLLSNLTKAEFSGKALSVAQLRAEQRIILIGLGKKKELTRELLRRAGGIAAKVARQVDQQPTLLLPTTKFSPAESAHALVEGALLGDYRFTRYKSETDELKQLKRITLHAENATPALKAAVADATLLAESTNYARDLVNTPPMDLHPASLEQAARKLAKQHKMKCTVFQAKELEKRKMHAILAVGKGSDIPPRMIILEYKRPGAKEHLVFCGKGVCYDSGGYNLKTKMQEDMKDDMGGSAALLGMLNVVASRKTKAHITVIIGAVENLISGRAYKPGDVVRAMNGKTIEVVNTDAEGRVVLADCLSYASKLKCSTIIDVATLTGAAMVSLGTLAGAVLSNNKKLVEQLLAAGESSGDRAWQMPFWEDYREDVKSEIADVKNLGQSFLAGVQAGGSLLQEFVADPSKWAHIDMGGSVNESRERPYIPKGATGWGVRILSEFVAQR